MLLMEQIARSVSWEAPEHMHGKHGGDWFLALGILTVAVVVAALLFGNFLFAILAALSGASIAVAASQPAQILQYVVSVRGIQVHETVYSFATLKSYYISEEDPRGPQLLIMGKKTFMPLIIMPIPEEYIDEIEEIMMGRLPEEYLEEPFFNKVLELLGF
jgi:hypothetical protein